MKTDCNDLTILEKVCTDIRAVRSDVVQQEQLLLGDVYALLSMALSDAEGVLAKVKKRTAVAR